ncbi:GRIN3A [Mytilus edulis]|uniref:GRIN3A n=1 Tax=Mytilus edulis TaxID=6550 RepID=A0A8S3RTN1_MYTED|nr:GRIN3A [Mytilus edulis]
MSNLSLVVSYIVISVTIVISYGKQIQLSLICDESLYNLCAKQVRTYEKTYQRSNSIDNVVFPIKIKNGTSDLLINYQQFNVNDDFWNIFVVFGDDVTTNAAAVVATTYHIPVFLYTTSQWHNNIYPSEVVALNGNRWNLGQATAAVVESHYLPKTCFIIDYRHLNDQFLEGFVTKTGNYEFNNTQIIIFRDEEDISTLSLKLTQIREHGYRLIIAHIKNTDIKTLFQLCQQQGYFEPGFAWILSDMSMPASDIEEKFYPSGLLALQSQEIDGLESLIEKSLISISDFVEELNSIGETTAIYNNSVFRDQVISYVTSKRYNDSSNKGLSFDEEGRRTNYSYVVRNKEVKNNITLWKDVGHVGSDTFTLNTIYWPGHTIFGPVKNISPRHRVVTRPAEPFVFIHGPVVGVDSCFTSKPCCLVSQTEPIAKGAFIDNCFTNSSDSIYCCSGIAIELLDVLSKDLKFDYAIYFENDTNYGNLINDTMNGMVGDILSGVADMIVGAFSITSARSKLISFTETFHYSGYSLVMKKEITNPSIVAFLKPFDDNVWLLVILSAIGTGIATSLLEWNSPFGLNPWARKRAKNYTLGSGLTMVFSLWFGHTVSTKPPKGWPSKVLQNVWAAMAIFIVASYTANLAAYLAGIVNETQDIIGIQDNQLESKKIAMIETSAVADFLNKVDSKLTKPVFVSGLDEGLQGLRKGIHDVYVDDTQILQYKLAEIDSKCTIKFSGSEFGENFYAFGLPSKSIWLEEKLSSLILDYVENGYLVTITKKFVSVRDCKEQMSTESVNPYDLQQTGGLFIMLVCGLALSILLLVGEHAAFKYLVPYLRKQATDSRWKSRRTLEFFNQRLYRTVMSETLVSPQQTAREMMMIMKDRQFTRMFQKNELQQKAVQRAPRKGLKFMNLTDILLRSASEDRSLCNGDSAIFSTSSSGKLYNISEEEEINNGKMTFPIESQEFDDVFFNDSTEESSPEDIQEKNNVFTLHHNNSDTNLDKQHLQVNHLWDHKLHSISSEYVSATAELNVIKKKRLQLSHSDSSHLARQKVTLERENEPSTLPVAAPQPNKPTSSSKSKCYYSSSVKLKDNRVKSTIRRHALAQFKRHSTTVFDECAVEALSKEDLLVLWKRSEIELQTKLNKLQSQNNHLKCLLAIVESDDPEEPTRTLSKKKKLLCTKL